MGLEDYMELMIFLMTPRWEAPHHDSWMARKDQRVLEEPKQQPHHWYLLRGLQGQGLSRLLNASSIHPTHLYCYCPLEVSRLSPTSKSIPPPTIISYLGLSNTSLQAAVISMDHHCLWIVCCVMGLVGCFKEMNQVFWFLMTCMLLGWQL